MNDQRDTKDSALSRVYREGAWPEPSRQIDQAILRAARAQRSFVRRWAPSFAIAATVVLSFTVLLMSRDHPEIAAPIVTDRSPAPRPKEPAAEAPKPAREAKPATHPQPAPATRMAPGFTSKMDEAEAERLDRIQRDLPQRGSPASESPLPREKPAQLPRAPVVRAPQTPAPTPKPVAAEKAAAAEQYTFRQQVAPRGEPVQPASAPLQAAQPAPAPQTAPVQAAPVPSAPVFASGALGASPPRAARSVAELPERAPQTWLEDIRKLKAQGRTEEAERSLADFKKRYPDYALPEDLR